MSGSPNPEATRRRGTGWIIAGAVVFVVSVGFGLLVWTLVDRHESSAVEQFVRAPAGCDTTVIFRAPGTYQVFLETRGRLGGPEIGDCRAPTVYGRADGSRPRVQLSLVDAVDAAVIPLERTRRGGYSTSHHRGDAIRQVVITEARTAIARVAAPDGEDVVIAIGPDVAGAVRPWRWAAMAVMVLGPIVAVAMLVTGVIRRQPRFPDPVRGPPVTKPLDSPMGARPQRPLSPPLPPPTDGRPMGPRIGPPGGRGPNGITGGASP